MTVSKLDSDSRARIRFFARERALLMIFNNFEMPDIALHQNPIAIFKLGSTFPKLAKEIGDFEDWFIRSLAGTVPIKLLDAQAEHELPEHSALAGVILTGSNCMVTDRQPWSERLRPWIAEAVEHGLPLLGVCYGHQLLADALGGVVAPRPQGVEIGTISVTRAAASEIDPLFATLPRQFFANAVHWQSIECLPPKGIRLASSEADPNQAFRVGENAWGVQFHPEFSEQAMRFYIDAYEDVLRETGTDLTVLRQQIRLTKEVSSLVNRFAEICRSTTSKRLEG